MAKDQASTEPQSEEKRQAGALNTRQREFYSPVDFSLIMELVELRDIFTHRATEQEEQLSNRQEALAAVEEEVKDYQKRVRKLREYISDGQQKFDRLPGEYQQKMNAAHEQLKEYDESIKRLEEELKK